MRLHVQSPAFLLTAFIVIIVAATAAIFYAVLSRPYVDLKIDTARSPFVTMEGQNGTRALLGLLAPGTFPAPGSALTERASLEALLAADPEKGIYFERDDFVEDPDMLVTYPAINRFYQRQQRISDLAQPGTLLAATANADSSGPIEIETLRVDAMRPFASLTVSFWLQVGCGLVVILIAAFCLALRPRNFAVSAFAIAGLGITGAAYTAVIYSSRQFGMDAEMLMQLSAVNHVFTISFGFGMIALFSQYPRRLVDPLKFLGPIVLCGALAMAGYRSQILPLDLVAMQNIVALQLAIILVMIGWQFWVTRGRPADRAALLWLGLSVIVGSAAFVALVTFPVSLGYKGFVTQAFGFVPLCMIYIGTGFAVSRYRLFDIGQWSYRILLYSGVIVSLLLIDAIFVTGLQMSSHTSLAAASVLALFGYLPLRDYIYDRLLDRRSSDLPTLYRKAVAVAYQFGTAAKEAAWIAVLADVFRPGHIEMGGTATEARIHNEGIELALPAFAWSQPVTLALAAHGRRLFSKADIQFVGELADLVSAAEADRLSYEKGAKEERRRIARDLHDEVGATLLSGLHSTSHARRQESIVDALADIRQISRELTGQDVTLERLVGQLRHESRDRAELHGRQMEWPLGGADSDESILPYRFHRSLSAMLREAISNALTHGGNPIRIEAGIDAGRLVVKISNPLAADDPMTSGSVLNRGQGLPNIQARAEDLGGMARFTRTDGRYLVEIAVPLPREAAA